MAKGETVLLAHNYEPGKHAINSWFMSEKYDGMRAIWDGGVTRSQYADKVGFANTEKDGRYLTRPVCTGLWSRYLKPIQAPAWFLDSLPPFPLDGELYIGRGQFQSVVSIVKDLVPDDDAWRNVKFCVFDAPKFDVLFGDRDVKITAGKNVTRIKIANCPYRNGLSPIISPYFENVYAFLQREHPTLTLVEQEQLHWNTAKAELRLMEKLDEVTSLGGEGLMLRHPSSIWTPERSYQLLKVKKLNDAEGIVVGCTFGRATDRGSKLLGLMGAIIVQWQGITFELSGFTDVERQLTIDGNDDAAYEYARKHEGAIAPPEIIPKHFAIGTTITFRYRDLTNDGKPKEARFLRKA